MKFENGSKVTTKDGFSGTILKSVDNQYVIVSLDNGTKKAVKKTDIQPEEPPIISISSTPISTAVTSTSILSNDKLKEVSDKIYKKPTLISRAELSSLGKDIKLVNYNQLLDLETTSSKSFSPRLLNWVEPYEITGILKSLFYTEYNSNLKVGDRVFIIGGAYDSDTLIKIDKYKKGRDGYKVLFIENCKIVLDIDYTGTLPYLEEGIDNFIKVYYIRTLSEFVQANRHITTGTGVFDYKFNPNQNNIAFIDQDYTWTKNWGLNGGVTGSPGFYVRNGITQSWTNITNEFVNMGSYSVALSATYSNNDRIKILNGDITYNGKTYRENYVYKWYTGPTQSEWIVDVNYKKPFITKANFRDGNFDGTWNTGLFGTHNKKIVWEGDKSTWNAGTLLNSVWRKGNFGALYSQVESFTSDFDTNGLPVEKVNTPNNNGRSFNYIIDSEIQSSNIQNGSILNSIIGTTSADFSVVEKYLLNQNPNYPNTIQKAYIEDCNLNHTLINNSEIKNIKAENSIFKKVKSTNSFFKNSVFYNSTYSSESIVKILGYDELNAIEYPGISSVQSVGGSFEFDPLLPTKQSVQKVYKFYISEESYNKIKVSDNFYIKDVRLNNNSNEILNIFDKKFRIGSWTEYIDSYNIYTNSFYKRPIDMSVFLSTPLENSYLFESVKQGPPDFYYTSVYAKNPLNLYSIDIWVSLFDLNEQNLSYGVSYLPELQLFFDLNTLSPNNLNPATYSYLSATGSGPISFGNIVDISNSYVMGSNFESGLFDNSNWNSGNHMNSQNDLNITIPLVTGGEYNMAFTQSNSIRIISSYDGVTPTENDYSLKVGQVVFLDAVDFDDGTNIVRLPDSYKVTSSSNGIYILEEIVTGNSSQLISLSASTGNFYTKDANNRYNYIKSAKFKDSTIKSGIFRRPYIVSSLIQTNNYNSLDLDYNDLATARNLVITDILSNNKSNILSSATYLYSSFNIGSDIWSNGIIQNSIWNSGTFSSGTIKESTWMNGVFTNGYFYNSKSFDATPTSDYQFYDLDRIKTYWKSGMTDGSQYLPPAIIETSNNRFSWRDGKFIDGQFYRSDWEGGTFSGGRFWYSKWYNGIFENGTIGKKEISAIDTQLYGGLIKYASVDNAFINAKDNSYLGLSGSNILWENGIFKNGVFRVEVGQAAQNYGTWSNGTFYDGEFTTMAKWKNGTFNGGKFTSYYGWTQSESATQSDYGWENGIFNGGEFGNADLGTNSTWYQGTFNGGVFKGRVWNYGVFLYGEFRGSGNNPVGGLTSSNASSFVDSYTNSYYGKWRNGIVTDTKDRLIKDEKVSYAPKKATEIVSRRIPGKLKNILWENGTFSHPNASIEYSVWLDGAFEKGRFISSTFNPYVKRNSSLTASFNLNDETCYWENGILDDSEFYISKWKQGTFNTGTATGMIWQNGVANYMNAYNVFWEDGLWRNGNWNGSSWNFNYEVTEDYVKQILFRGMSWSGTSSCHVWNIFLDNTYVSESLSIQASTPSIIYPQNNFSNEAFDFDQESPNT